MADRAQIYAGVRTKLLASAGVTAIVTSSSRIIQGWLPRGQADADFPCITLWEIGSAEMSVDQGPHNGSVMDLQIDLWGRDADVLMALEVPVRDAVNAGFTATGWRIQSSRITGSSRMWDPDPLLARRMLTARIQALPA